MRRNELWRSLLLGFLMAAGILSVNRLEARAAAMPEMKSSGRITWDNGTADKNDDITIFDSKDIEYLYQLADPDNDELWRTEESCIKGGKIQFNKGESSLFNFDNSKLKEIESYIKQTRKAYEEGGEVCANHYPLSEFITKGTITGKSWYATSAQNNKSYSLKYALSKDFPCYYNGSLNIDKSCDPASSIKHRALNTGYVRITSPTSTTGKVQECAYGDYYENDNPEIIYSTSLGSYFSSKERLNVYVDIIYKERHAGNGSDKTLKPDMSGFPPLRLLFGKTYGYCEDLNNLISFVDKQYTSSETTGGSSTDYSLLKVGSIDLPSTNISDLPISKFEKEGYDFRSITLKKNMSGLYGYERLKADDFLVTSSSMYWQINDDKNSCFIFPCFPESSIYTCKDYIEYDESTGALSYTLLMATKKGQDVEGFTIDGSFDIYVSLDPATYELISSSMPSQNIALPGVYNGMGERIFTWDELKASGLDMAGSGNSSKSLRTVLDEKGVLSAVCLIFPSDNTGIKDQLCWNLSFLSSILIPEGVTDIGNQAFYNCKNLHQVLLPHSLKNIGSKAFNSVGLEVLDLRETSVETIGVGSFWGSQIKELYFPDTLTTIGADAFCYCQGLDGFELRIPGSVKTLSNDCFNLKYITNDNVSLGKIIFESGFQGDFVSTKGKTTANYYPYWGTDKTILEFEDGVKKIGKMICRGYPYSLSLPESVKEVSDEAFSNCSGEISLNEGLVTMGNGVFRGYKGSSVTIPSTVTTMGYQTFQNAEHPYITYLNSPTEIKWGTYDGCHYDSIEGLIPPSVTKISKEAFRYNDFETVVIPDNVQVIWGQSIFENCTKLKNISFPAGLNSSIARSSTTDDCKYMFQNCTSLETLDIEPFIYKSKKKPEGTSSNGTFVDMNKVPISLCNGCVSLTVTVPSYVTDMPQSCFMNVKSLYYYGSTTIGKPWGAKMLNDVPQ